MNQPVTKKEEFIEKKHGQKVPDFYRWLENDKSIEARKWIKIQDKYTRAMLNKNTQCLKIKKRLGEIFRINESGIPVPRRGNYFYTQRKPSEDFSVLYIKKGLHGKSQELINPNKMSKDKSVTLTAWMPSDDGLFLAYQLSESGNDQSCIKVMDVKKKKDLDDFIPYDIYPNIQKWSRDNNGFWYIKRHPDAPKGEEKFHKKIYFHRLGDNYKNDEFVFGEKIKKEDFPSVSVSEDNRYLLINIRILSEKKSRNEIYLIDRQDKTKKKQPVFVGIMAQFFGVIYKERIYLITDYNAPKWRIISAPINDIHRKVDEWDEIIPETNDILNNFIIVRNNLFVEKLVNACSSFGLYSLRGKLKKIIKLPLLGTLNNYSVEKEGQELFFSFSSYTMPQVIYRYDFKKRDYEVFAKNKVPVDFNSFVVNQKWFSSKDGTKIPMFVAHKKGLEMNGNNPTLVYGYGGFDHSITPKYTGYVIPFIEAGGIYVEVNLRGGGEFGEKWHEAGMRDKKQNVFNDFISAIEYLIEEKYTNSSKIGIFGWSNGGLLTASVTAQRPDLIKVSVIGAPVIDMVRYHLFHGGRHWIPEYGDPDKKKDFDYLIKYSPYHNTEENEYPAVLIITADKDDRVHPMHAYKMAAILQEKNKSDNPILIRIEQKAGHSGARAKSKFIDRYGDILGFIFWQLEVNF
ncbi:prolyl oligopeptidase family serine peptidase [Candidatus Parcubacteria bacterium]|nr:prolyl oligopeptidase family serine peptidase [Candidatus Parcubacteria bacterium]